MAKKTRQSSAVETKPTKEFGFQVSTTATTLSIGALGKREFHRGTFRRINDSEKTVASNEFRFCERSRGHCSLGLCSNSGEYRCRRCAFEAFVLLRRPAIPGIEGALSCRFEHQ